MKNLIFVFLFSFVALFPAKKAQAIDPKTKAFLIVTGYGTVGGALLGFASLAFGTNPRAVAQGASLGLYTGIIFGAYVLTSYQQPGPQPEIDTYPEPYPRDPYAPGGGYPPPRGGFGEPPPQDDGGFFGSPNRAIEINQDLIRDFGMKKGSNMPPIYLNLLNMQF